MCEAIVQTCDAFAALAPLPWSAGSIDPVAGLPGGKAVQGVAKRERLVKPKMRLRAIVVRDGQPVSVEVRWGWVPDWSMGARAPLTHLSLEQVMRASQYARLRGQGRALIPVEGWYESTVDGAQAKRTRQAFVTSRSAGPLFLAAIAHVGEHPSGCDGLALVTHDAGSGTELLALDAQAAQAWLATDLDWQRAQTLANSVIGEAQLEQLFIAKRQQAGTQRKAFGLAG